jgi:hypothetical protein
VTKVVPEAGGRSENPEEIELDEEEEAAPPQQVSN